MSPNPTGGSGPLPPVVWGRHPWLGRGRRLTKDDEAPPETREARIRIAMIRLVLKLLAPT